MWSLFVENLANLEIREENCQKAIEHYKQMFDYYSNNPSKNYEKMEDLHYLIGDLYYLIFNNAKYLVGFKHINTF